MLTLIVDLFMRHVVTLNFHHHLQYSDRLTVLYAISVYSVICCEAYNRYRLSGIFVFSWKSRRKTMTMTHRKTTLFNYRPILCYFKRRLCEILVHRAVTTHVASRCDKSLSRGSTDSLLSVPFHCRHISQLYSTTRMQPLTQLVGASTQHNGHPSDQSADAVTTRQPPPPVATAPSFHSTPPPPARSRSPRGASERLTSVHCNSRQSRQYRHLTSETRPQSLLTRGSVARCRHTFITGALAALMGSMQYESTDIRACSRVSLKLRRLVLYGRAGRLGQ